jgi:hypothetical protein
VSWIPRPSSNTFGCARAGCQGPCRHLGAAGEQSAVGEVQEFGANPMFQRTLTPPSIVHGRPIATSSSLPAARAASRNAARVVGVRQS